MDRLREKLQAWSEAVKPLWLRRGVKKCFVTLTYDTDGTLGVPSEWSPLHISKYIKALRIRSGLEVLAYSWVVEVQRRGVPHYHIVLLYRGTVPYPDKSGMWKYGMSNIKFRLRSPFYLVRYTGKQYQKDFSQLPKGTRAFACSISDKSAWEVYKSLLLPPVIRERYLVEGVSALADIARPDYLRCVFVGNAETKEFADYLENGV